MILDYLTLLDLPTGKNDRRDLAVGRIANEAKHLALSLNLKTGEWKLARDDEIVQATLICDAGQVVAKK